MGRNDDLHLTAQDPGALRSSDSVSQLGNLRSFTKATVARPVMGKQTRVKNQGTNWCSRTEG